jgi:hypothetical protein
MAYLGYLAAIIIDTLFRVTAWIWDGAARIVTYALEVSFPAQAEDLKPPSERLSERQVYGPMAARAHSFVGRRLQRDPVDLPSGLGLRIAV